VSEQYVQITALTMDSALIRCVSVWMVLLERIAANKTPVLETAIATAMESVSKDNATASPTGKVQNVKSNLPTNFVEDTASLTMALAFATSVGLEHSVRSTRVQTTARVMDPVSAAFANVLSGTLDKCANSPRVPTIVLDMENV